MEIKHTLEILTKDIQDIEKLVANLQNSKEGSHIELDLALSKLRNVYEILTLIKADRLHEMITPEMEEPAEPAPKPAPKPISEPLEEFEVKVVPRAEEAGQKAEPATKTETAAQAEAEPAFEPEEKPEPSTAPQEPVTFEAEAESEAELEAKKEAEILAEKFSAESSVNENLAGQRGEDMDSKLTGQPIENIGRNIGINDRFLIIRELFNGDADQFSNLIHDLDGAGNYRNAYHMLEEQFAGTMEHEGVEILTGLVKRRFIRE